MPTERNKEYRIYRPDFSPNLPEKDKKKKERGKGKKPNIVKTKRQRKES